MVCFCEVFHSPEIQEKLVVAHVGLKGIPTELGPGMWNFPLSFKGAKEESEEAKEGEEEEGEGEGEEAAAEEGEESQEAAEEAAEEEKEEKEEKEAAGKEESEGKKKAWSALQQNPLTELQLQSHPFNSVPTEVPAHDSDVSPRAESEFACRAPKACSPSAAWFHVWVQGSCLPWVTQNLHISNGRGKRSAGNERLTLNLHLK